MPFVLDVGKGLLSLRLSPLKRDMGKQPRSPSEQDPGDSKSKQLKFENRSENVQKSDIDENQPTSKEVAAALAARARLYGGAVETSSGGFDKKGKLPDGPEPTVPTDVVYTPSEEILYCDVTPAEVQEAINRLGSKDWVSACKGLTVVRQLALHHPNICSQNLAHIVPLVVNAVKSLRTSVCKMAILTTTDLVASLPNELMPFLDIGGAARPTESLLGQLLLKGGSNDKRFVIDEVDRALARMTQKLDAEILLEKLLPYSTHKGPKVRGKVAVALAATVDRLCEGSMSDVSLVDLLKVAAKLVEDNTPEAREGARNMITSLRCAYIASGHIVPVEVEGKENSSTVGNQAGPPDDLLAKKQVEKFGHDGGMWTSFCSRVLTPSDALSVLRAV